MGRRWDVERVQDVIFDIAYNLSEQGIEEVNIKTLKSLGSEPLQLYNQILRPGCNIVDEEVSDLFGEDKWGSFMDLLSEELEGIQEIASNKRDYSMLSERERQEISALEHLVDMKFITEGEAREDFREMPWHTIHYERKFFPDESSLRKRSESDILKVLDQHKKERGIDRSNLDFVKGNLYEALVGNYLVETYGRENVRAQVLKKVDYTGLDEKEHKQVILDFLVNDNEIIESKWKNGLDNILESILPQIQAMKDDVEKKGITKKYDARIIARNKDEDTLAYYLENINLKKDIEKMRLKLEGRTQELFGYDTFDDLIRSNSELNQSVYFGILDKINELIEKEDVSLMKNYKKALERIYLNGEDVSLKIELFHDAYVSKNKRISCKEVNDLFGQEKIYEEEKRGRMLKVSMTNHSEKRTQKNNLLQMYNTYFGTEEKKLTEEMVGELNSLSIEDKNLTASCLCDVIQGKSVRRNGKKKKDIDGLTELRNSITNAVQLKFDEYKLALQDFDALNLQTTEKEKMYDSLIEMLGLNNVEKNIFNSDKKTEGIFRRLYTNFQSNGLESPSRKQMENEFKNNILPVFNEFIIKSENLMDNLEKSFISANSTFTEKTELIDKSVLYHGKLRVDFMKKLESIPTYMAILNAKKLMDEQYEKKGYDDFSSFSKEIIDGYSKIHEGLFNDPFSVYCGDILGCMHSMTKRTPHFVDFFNNLLEEGPISEKISEFYGILTFQDQFSFFANKTCVLDDAKLKRIKNEDFDYENIWSLEEVIQNFHNYDNSLTPEENFNTYEMNLLNLNRSYMRYLFKDRSWLEDESENEIAIDNLLSISNFYTERLVKAKTLFARGVSDLSEYISKGKINLEYVKGNFEEGRMYIQLLDRKDNIFYKSLCLNDGEFEEYLNNTKKGEVDEFILDKAIESFVGEAIPQGTLNEGLFDEMHHFPSTESGIQAVADTIYDLSRKV